MALLEHETVIYYIYIYISISLYIYIYIHHLNIPGAPVFYGLATVSRIDQITGLLAEYSLFCRALSQKRPKI